MNSTQQAEQIVREWESRFDLSGWLSPSARFKLNEAISTAIQEAKRDLAGKMIDWLRAEEADAWGSGAHAMSNKLQIRCKQEGIELE